MVSGRTGRVAVWHHSVSVCRAAAELDDSKEPVLCADEAALLPARAVRHGPAAVRRQLRAPVRLRLRLSSRLRAPAFLELQQVRPAR